MPYINVQVTREGVTRQQKRDIIAGVTRLMQNILNKDPRTTHVVIQEIDTDNWGVGGGSVTDLRKAQAKQHNKP
jgi:4-oxalocrotonate tautomerase